ncbi:MAG TPA: transcription elongation factor GreA [Solirubrobacterales bacterium]|nr:transcription elongation factor GreA [Solirubrobacterales bacterium]
MSGPGQSGGGGEPITAEGMAALKAEIAELEGPGRAQMAERIKAARELGDLKENADYHIAKEDQAHLETRIKRLREREKNAEVVETGEGEGGDDSFAFGSTAEVLEESSGEIKTWTLVGSTEADLAEGRLSAESPVGQALRDARVGETVTITTPKGDRRFRIERLLPG